MMGLHSKEDGLVLRVSEHVPDVVKQILIERGWNELSESDDEAKANGRWNLWWKTQRFRKSNHDEIEPWQRLNHFPRTDAITRKDSLVRNLRRMRCVYGANVFDFHPAAYILPNEYLKFVSDYAKESQKHGKKDLYWICKPVDLSRGRGIFIFHDLKQLTYDCPVIVQRYLTNPLLISGYKFDLRIYVCVPSFQPLTIYTYQEGIARFSTDKFDLSQLNNVFSHLTNTSINKYGPSYATDKERVGPGCKWTLSQLRSFLRQMGDVDEALLWMRISNIITLTLATQAPSVPKCRNCFEVFGFDILVDEQLKPWLLEVNFSPALSMDCQADFIAKRSMLNDLVDLLNFKETDSDHGGMTSREEDVVSPISSARRSLYGGPEVLDPRRPLSSRRSAPNNAATASAQRRSAESAFYPARGFKRLRNSSSSLDAGIAMRRSSSLRASFPSSLPKVNMEPAECVEESECSKDHLPRNASSCSLSSSVSSVDHSNQPENSDESCPVPLSKVTVSRRTQSVGAKRNKSAKPLNDTTMLYTKQSKRDAAKLATIDETNKASESTSDIVAMGHLFTRLSKHARPTASGSYSSPKTQRRKTPLNSLPFRPTSACVSSDVKNPASRSKIKRASSEYKSPYSISSTAAKRVTQSNSWPRTRVGDFVLTFPLSETMRRASGSCFEMKTIIREQQRIIKKLVENRGKRFEERRRSSTDFSAAEALHLKFQLMLGDDEANPLYFWGLQNPPLLSSVLS